MSDLAAAGSNKSAHRTRNPSAVDGRLER